MPKETLESVIKKQQLIIIGDHAQEEEDEIKKKFTPPPEGANDPGQMYDQIYPDYSKKEKPEWLKQAISIEASSSKIELAPDKDL